MIPNLEIYYLPQNGNIVHGKIYNVYLNKVTNLDLSSIVSTKNQTFNQISKPSQEMSVHQKKSSSMDNISITEDDYQNIIKLANDTTILSDKTQELVKKISRGRKK